MSEWKWYFTPEWSGGAAFEAQRLTDGKAQVRKVTHIIASPDGNIGLMRWVPLHVQMCEPIGNVDLDKLAHFPANAEAVEKLNQAWAFAGRIVRPNGPIPRG